MTPGEEGGGAGAVAATDRPQAAEERDPEVRATDARRIAVFGGVYSNWRALEAVVEDARRRGADELYCLGDLGAFGPNPDRIPPRLIDADVRTIRGNYDDSISRGLDDCQCGYTDPRDNHFARLSYRYTFRNTSERWREWMGTLPEQRRIEMAGREVLMCHGSPRRMNEFLWESTSSTQFLDWMAREHGADVVLCTHTGIHWKRRLSGGGWFANVGCIGRPPNDGRTDVWYTLLSTEGDGGEEPTSASSPGEREAPAGGNGGRDRSTGDGGDAALEVEFVPVSYDHEALAEEMRREELPEEFVETILTGWWTTCLEVLPAKERRRGRH
ncbi:MAG: metallophosphoesterase family protein [Candidatus Palauibacterales bacterium]|nr:metallophosphoesterase family protein [Candidatus Palauibacterales bacterium]